MSPCLGFLYYGCLPSRTAAKWLKCHRVMHLRTVFNWSVQHHHQQNALFWLCLITAAGHLHLHCFCTLCANHLLSFFWHWSILQYSFVLFWAIIIIIIATVNYAAFVLCKSSVLSWSINKTSAIWRKKYYATANNFPGMFFSSVLLSSTLLQFPHCYNFHTAAMSLAMQRGK